jgi:hypothetical protein
VWAAATRGATRTGLQWRCGRTTAAFCEPAGVACGGVVVGGGKSRSGEGDAGLGDGVGGTV